LTHQERGRDSDVTAAAQRICTRRSTRFAWKGEWGALRWRRHCSQIGPNQHWRYHLQRRKPWIGQNRIVDMGKMHAFARESGRTLLW